jgi:His/Glu/Gln/Arg/opine family amino acid ABC transporter permease subunit
LRISLGAKGFVGVNSFAAGAIAVGIISGAYQGEIFRGAFHAIARGELEAARSVGMPRLLLFRRIIAPQALRFAIPGLGNVWQLALKESALISVVGLTELLRQAQVGAGSTRQPFEFFITAAVLYLLLSTCSGMAFARAEASRCAACGGAEDGCPLHRRDARAADLGIPLTLKLAFYSIAAGAVFAMLLALMRLSANRALDYAARSYVFVFRGTPLLVQIFLIYYGLGQFPEIRQSFLWPFLREPYWCALLALTLNTAPTAARSSAAGSCPFRSARSRLRARAACRARSSFAASSCRRASSSRCPPTATRSSHDALDGPRFSDHPDGSHRHRLEDHLRDVPAVEVFVCAGAIYLLLNFVISRAIASSSGGSRRSGGARSAAPARPSLRDEPQPPSSCASARAICASASARSKVLKGSRSTRTKAT